MALENIPGLAGFNEQSLINQRQSANQLRQVGEAVGLMGALRRQEMDGAMRRDLQALGPDPSQEDVVRVASKYASPEKVLAIHQDALNRKESAKDRALQFAQNLYMRQQQLDQAREQFAQRQADANSRIAFEQWYKTQSLGIQRAASDLNAALRTMGLEVQRQGQQLQIERFNQANKEREDKLIESQVGKTADRMKDIGPVLSAAQQLNKLMSQYSPEEVPGVGYAKNTDIGKVFLSDEGKNVSSSIKLFGNSVLKAMSGAAVTAPEEIRQMAAQMADGRFSAKDFYIAWPKMAEWVNSQAQLAGAGLTPPARERFKERTGMDLAPITPRYRFESGGLVDTQTTAAGKVAPAAPAGLPPPPPGFRVKTPTVQ